MSKLYIKKENIIKEPTVGNLKELLERGEYIICGDLKDKENLESLVLENVICKKDGQYLVFGISEDELEFYAELTPYGIENFYKNAKNTHNVIIQAHPFRNGVTLAPVDSIDGIEAYNMHPNHNQRNALSTKHAKNNDLLITGGSDFHHITHHALCLMRTKNKLKDSYDVAQAIKSKDVVFDSNGSIIIPYIY